jgi:GSH-dependent disulfide-bond oxidoreductase
MKEKAMPDATEPSDTRPLILHGMSSPNVLKVGIMLEECGLRYESRFVGVFNGDQYSADFLALNPLAKVPVLEDPRLGIPIYESGAILIWLAERQGRFLPADQPARAEVLQWLMVQMANMGPMLGQLNHFRLSLAGKGDPYATGRYQAASEKIYRLLDGHLADREWIAGGAYSIADMAVYPWSDYLERHGFDPSEYPALLRWRATVGSRPAVTRARDKWSEAFALQTRGNAKAASDDDLDRFFGRTNAVPPVDYSNLRNR